tara:strand:+ start:256 stop:993 length:738 start_codon:yes stop_codon:yes gene_type:complete
MYFTYVTTNKINGKRYIGLSSMNKSNWKEHLGSGKLLLKAISKYGKENFEREILKYFDSLEDVIEAERSYILENSCHTSPEWYNIAVGFTTQGFKGKTHSKETKEKIASYGRSRPATEKMRQNMSIVGKMPRTKSQIKAFKKNAKRVGKRNKGRIVSKETRKKMSEAHKGKKTNIVYTQEMRDKCSKRFGKDYIIEIKGQKSIKIHSLKKWCEKNNVSYHSLYHTLKSKNYNPNGMRLHKIDEVI